jgi:hypothetical protein
MFKLPELDLSSALMAQDAYWGDEDLSKEVISNAE